MAPRITTREAFTVDLPINPFARRRMVAAYLIDIAEESGITFEVSGLIGRTELIQATQMADEADLIRNARSENI